MKDLHHCSNEGNYSSNTGHYSPSGGSEGLAQGDERSEELADAAVAFFEVGTAESRDETGVAILVGNV